MGASRTHGRARGGVVEAVVCRGRRAGGGGGPARAPCLARIERRRRSFGVIAASTGFTVAACMPRRLYGTSEGTCVLQKCRNRSKRGRTSIEFSQFVVSLLFYRVHSRGRVCFSSAENICKILQHFLAHHCWHAAAAITLSLIKTSIACLNVHDVAQLWHVFQFLILNDAAQALLLHHRPEPEKKKTAFSHTHDVWHTTILMIVAKS